MIPRVLEPEVMDTAEEAQDYDAMDHAEVNGRFCEEFAALASGFAGRPMRVLDVGTGTARIPILICGRIPGASFVATDLSREMLAIAKTNVERAALAPRITFAIEDAKKTSFGAGSFDGVVSNTILHHVPEPEGAIAEMWRVLAPRGVFFVRDLSRPSSDAEVAALVDRYGGAPASRDPKVVAAHARQVALFEASLRASLTVDELRPMLARIGIPADAAKMTSDRHWTIACVKPS